MFNKLEIYYLANKSENLYFALLGDCSEEKKQKMETEEEQKYRKLCDILKNEYC